MRVYVCEVVGGCAKNFTFWPVVFVCIYLCIYRKVAFAVRVGEGHPVVVEIVFVSGC